MTQNESGDVKEQSALLLDGPLKHVRAAALAAALVPLASVVATPAMAQQSCSGSAVIGDYVWDDANKNGIQDMGESGIAGAVVTLRFLDVEMTPSLTTATDANGAYQFGPRLCGGKYRVEVMIPPGYQITAKEQGVDRTVDSNGEPDGLGNSYAELVLPSEMDSDNSIDFGFFVGVAQPGTGTPGYWKNHPEAWPVQGITVGNVYYTKDHALAILSNPGSDKSYTMFSSLVPAMLNVMIGNDGSCVSSTITEADAWMATSAFKGSKVAASSLAWKIGEPLHRLMDNYNNGMLCAPHRE